MNVAKKFGIVFLMIGLIILVASLYPITNDNSGGVNHSNTLLYAMVGLLFILLGLSNLRTSKGALTEFHAALQNIENSLAPISRWMRSKNLYRHSKFIDCFCFAFNIICCSLYSWTLERQYALYLFL